MPQTFQVLKCYKCFVFQVRKYHLPIFFIHQTKKFNKFECKMCGEKQSIKRHYGIGTGKDCRMHVQRLNLLRGSKETNYNNENSDEECEETNISNKILDNIVSSSVKPVKKSKWSDFVDTEDEIEGSKKEMLMEDAEVLVESPQKRKTRKVKTKSNNSEMCYNPINNSNFNMESNCGLSNNEDNIKPKKSLNVIVDKPVVLQTVNQNSRWAQFIDTEEKSDINSDVMPENDQSENAPGEFSFIHEIGENPSRPKNLFSLCDDDDLDEVLGIRYAM